MAITVVTASDALLLHREAGPVEAFEAAAAALAKAHQDPVVVIAPQVTLSDEGFEEIAEVLKGRFSDGIRLVFLGSADAMLRREDGLRLVSRHCGHPVTGSFGPVLVAADGTCTATGWIKALPSGGTQYSAPWSPEPEWTVASTGAWENATSPGELAVHPVPAGLWLVPAGQPVDRGAAVPALSRDPRGMLVVVGGGEGGLPVAVLTAALDRMGFGAPARLVVLPGALRGKIDLADWPFEVLPEPVTTVWASSGFRLMLDPYADPFVSVAPADHAELVDDPLSILEPAPQGAPLARVVRSLSTVIRPKRTEPAPVRRPSVPVAACDDDDRRRLREVLGESFAQHVVDACQALRISAETEDQWRAVASVAALRAYWSDRRDQAEGYLGERTDPGLAHLVSCCRQGLARLPVIYGPVFVSASVPVPALDAGMILHEPGFLEVGTRPAVAPGATHEYLIWSLTARRLGAAVERGDRSAMFDLGTRFTVLGIDQDQPVPRVLLAERTENVAGVSHDSLAHRLLAMTSGLAAEPAGTSRIMARPIGFDARGQALVGA